MQKKHENSPPSDSSKSDSSDSGVRKFPIVCLGASAGGLEALERFLENTPQNIGMGFVVIQHLDPTHQGILPELLQRTTKMEVFQAKDGMRVIQNCVYVIPPNNSISIAQGVLHLSKPIETRGLRLPIDFFLKTLANDQHEYGIGIILSGMGSDGSAGIVALKENHGIVMAQEPTEAKFDSMPRNAIDTGLVDIVAPVSELPEKLRSIVAHVPVVKLTIDPEIKDENALEKITTILRTQTGNDFSLYKKNTMYRRIERRMGVHKLDNIASYVSFLQDNPKEVEILFKELLIGVTNFFRDADVWEKLQDSIIPTILENQAEGAILRAWVAGCSTGEEAYSLAIVFKEVLSATHPNSGISLQIFATDLDNDAIETARRGLFAKNIENHVSEKRLSRYFTPTENGYRVNTEIREMVIFAKHNIILHPPFTKLDLLTCRNLLIYMDAELQKKLLGLFYYTMNKEGFMLLGSAETLGSQSHFFSTIDAKLKFYKRSNTNQMPELFDFPSSFSRAKQPNIEIQMPAKPTQNIQTYADQLLLQHFSPPGVLVNEKGDIIYISGRTGKYLEPSVGKANMNIFAMLRDGLRNDFSSAFRQALMKKETIHLDNIKVGTNGGTQYVNVTIQWIDKPDALNGMLMIIFNDVAKTISTEKSEPKKGAQVHNTRQSELEKELQNAREEMQSNLEEMQTSQEELKSANEELQSTNEELQSTNEELTTSKEEMQSLNEELQTVNAELNSKVDDFSRVNNDMKNLLNSTDIATLFLDKDLNIRRFTNQATKIFKLIKSDIGRPFTDLVSDLIYAELADDAREVLRTLVFMQKQITTADGRWFTTRIMPYRTFDDRIDGLVITFFNISDHKKLEVELNETRQMHNLLINLSSDMIIKLTTDSMIVEMNKAAEKFFGKKSSEIINQNFLLKLIPEAHQKKTGNELNKLLKEAQNGNLTMQMIVGETNSDVDWSVNLLLNEQKVHTGIILIAKLKTS